MSKPKVSVRLMTYNHASYIKEAMDSIMMQETDFNFEVVVGDDFSTDNTLKIIKGYKPTAKIEINILERIKGDNYWTTRQAKGRLYNFENIIANCHGEYIALLDGDDYWCDPLKLQKQVNYLEEHSNVGMIYTGHFIYDEKDDKMIEYHSKNRVEESNNFTSLLIKNFIPTPTVMLRSELIHNAINEVNAKIKIHQIMDYPLWLSISAIKDIGFIPDRTAIYRLQENTASRPNDLQKKYDYIKNVFDIRLRICELYNCDKEIISTIKKNYYRKKLFYAFQNQDKYTAKEAIASIKNINGYLSLRDMVKYISTMNTLLNGIFNRS